LKLPAAAVLVPAAALLSAIAGCVHTTPAGCTEYKPMCIGTNHVCSTDARGCEVCTCESGWTGEQGDPSDRDRTRGNPYPNDVSLNR
jgi:hypothetical protein